MSTWPIFVWGIFIAWLLHRVLRYRRERRTDRACQAMKRVAQRYETIMERERD